MKLHYGNLLEMAKNGEFDVIIQGCNCFHTMGAGIAKYIKKDFPEAFAADKETKYADKNKLGSFSEATITRNGNTFVVINAYTQYQYGGGVDNFDYDSFPSLLAQIKTKYGHKRIGLPLIGCGLAMGDEPRILNMIKKGFDGLDYKLVEIDVNRKLNLGNVQEIKSEQNIEKEKYTFFFQATSPFSQWHPSFFTYRNYDFICGEQFMMFSKAKTFNDEAVADKIINIEKNFLNAKGEFNSADDKKCYELVMAFKNHEIDRNEVIKPENLAAWKRVQALIKKLGREVKNYDDKIWEAKRVPVVAVGNREKYNQNEDLKNLLLAEGNAIMVEASPYDKIWGIGLSASDAIKIDPAKWPGLNLLGNVLTDLKRHFQFELETTHSNHSKLKL